MVPYNTQVTPLVLRETGRNIQQMIDYCVDIPDREERNRCACAIAAIMAGLFPEMAGSEGERNIWDHMMVISGFRLDVDFPCEVTSREKLNPRPEPLTYPNKRIRYRHYGRLIQRMISKAVDMEDGEEKDALLLLIANQMKKVMTVNIGEEVNDERIFRDLAEYSDGKIMLDSSQFSLNDYSDLQADAESETKKKKRKKK